MKIYRNVMLIFIMFLSLTTMLVAPASAQSGLVDLQPVDLSGPSAIGTYQEMSIAWTVRNNGPGDAQPIAWWWDYVYFSADDVLDANDMLATGFKRTDGIAAGASLSLTANLRSPSVAGSYYLLLKTDATDAYAETDEANNVVAFGPITVTPPDLQPVDLSGPSAIGTYQEMSIAWTVRNNGPGDTQPIAWWWDYVYFSADDVLDANDMLATGFKRTEGIAAGASLSLTANLRSPSVAGSYYLLLKTDATNIYTEADEANNVVAFGPIYVGNTSPTANAGGPYDVPEGGSVTLSGSGSDSDGDSLTYAWDFDGDGNFETPGQNPIFSAIGRDGPDNQSVILQVCDDKGGCATSDTNVQITNAEPTLEPIVAPIAPVEVNKTIDVSAAFTDPGTLDTHTAIWDWGDGNTSAGIVTEANGSGTIDGHYTYTAANVYVIMLTVTDKDGASDQSASQYVVVYDASGGFVTGGGWIDSPAGAYVPEPTLAGQANFGFVSRYEQGATVPSGRTEFQFKAGDLNFRSAAYDWLVVAGAKAQFKGMGAINGAGEYGFLLTVTDGQVNGGGGVDKFRLKIWDRASNQVIYDNQMGAADETEPATVLGGGSIVIHK